MLDYLCVDVWRLVLGSLTPLEVAAMRGCARAFKAKWPPHDPIWKLVGPNANPLLLFAHIQSVESSVAFTTIYPDMFYSRELQWRQSLPALRYACHRGWLAKAQLISTETPAYSRWTTRRNWITRGSDAPLWRAFRAGHVHIVEWLVRAYQLDDTFKYYDRRWSFKDCCRKGHLELAQFVVRECSEANDTVNAANAGLEAASRHGQLAVVDWLLSLDKVSVRGMAAAFRDACRYGHLPVVLRLLDTGDLRPTEVAIRKESVMMAACAGGHLEVARALVGHYYGGRLLDLVFNDPTGFDVVVQCVTKACMAGHFAVAEWLVSSVKIPRELILRILIDISVASRPTIRWLLRRFRITISEVPQAAWITKPWLFKELR